MRIPESELQFEVLRASGPGGQNVNKVATAVRLRFDASGSPSLAPEVRARLLKLAGKRLTTAGEILILGQRFRTQEKNRADVIARLGELVERATVAPKKRRPTRPTRASERRRLEAKKRNAARKQERRGGSE